MGKPEKRLDGVEGPPPYDCFKSSGNDMPTSLLSIPAVGQCHLFRRSDQNKDPTLGNLCGRNICMAPLTF